MKHYKLKEVIEPTSNKIEGQEDIFEWLPSKTSYLPTEDGKILKVLSVHAPFQKSGFYSGDEPEKINEVTVFVQHRDEIKSFKLESGLLTFVHA